MPYGIYENIECDVGKHPPFTPQEHQSELLDYFLNKSVYKGIVAFHRLGSGKSWYDRKRGYNNGRNNPRRCGFSYCKLL